MHDEYNSILSQNNVSNPANDDLEYNLVTNKKLIGDDKDEDYDYIALNSLFSRVLYEISICTDTSLSNLSYMLVQYCFPFIIQLISIFVF